MKTQEKLKVFLLNSEELFQIKEQVRTKDSSLMPAYEKLLAEAEEALKPGPFSVVFKTATPPSGDKHDYMSMCPYWWPDPDTPNGLPYIRHDGKRNPEYFGDNYDITSWFSLLDLVTTLSLAYYFSEHQPYALRAVELVRTWFLNPDTCMNPNLNYAQGIPGRSVGRGIGIIEAHPLLECLDAIGLLKGSRVWKATDQKALEDWLENFLTWLLESKNGQEEANSKNNHGTYYDILCSYLAIYLGRTNQARRILIKNINEKVASQIETDGKQPLELQRTAALSYSVFNLLAHFKAALLGDVCGLNLWEFETNDGRSIRKALDWLVPYFREPEKWPYPQIMPLEEERVVLILRLAKRKYREPYFEETLRLFKPDWQTYRENLLYPVLD